MDRKFIRQRLLDEILVIDGVFGTLLQPHIPAGSCVDMTNIEKPDLVQSIIKEYADAGADILSTNTFGGSRVKLREFGLEAHTQDINVRAAQLARNVAPDNALVAGVIGPTGKLVEPLGELTFNEAFEAFEEQTTALAEGGVHLFLLETFADLKEIKAAVMAIQKATSLPIMASMTFDENYTCFTGTDPATAANVLSSLGVDALGVNCSTGPEPMLEVLGRYAMATDCPLFVEPNAGLPTLEGDNTTYKISPVDMAEFAEKFVQIGANAVGTCCGSSPEYTAEIKQRLKDKHPITRHVDPVLRLSSRVKTIEVGTGLPFCMIGERINPTNRETLAEEIRTGKVAFIQKEAKLQAAEGAHLLDVNIGVPGLDEPAFIGKAIRAIENVVPTPLSIDSVNPQAVEAALLECTGKPLINSVNGEDKSLDAIIPVAKKYGAGLLCLAVDEKGIPKTAEDRIAVLRKIIDRAETAGIRREDLICDCLTLTVSAQQKRANTTLKAIQIVKEDLKLPTVLGVSNISFGLPQRSLINATFLSMAMASGLDAAIINPGDERMKETIQAASVLTVRDKDSKAFVKSHTAKKKKKSAVEPPPAEDVNHIADALMSGNREEIGGLVEKELKSGQSAQEINNGILIPTIQEVGRQYDRKEIFLPQMILAAEAMQQAFTVLEPHFSSGDVTAKGKVLLCTVKGDVHDIGKNIVGLFLKNQGFEVVDLGKDVSTELIVQTALQQKIQIVGLSALMTTTMTEMPLVIQALKDAGSGAKVVVGGAVVTKKYAREIGADGYAKDGVEAVEVIQNLVTG